MIWATAWKFKTWIAIAVLSFICFGQLAYTNHLSGKLQEAETVCTAKIQEIEQKQLKALAEKQNEINKVSADYEAEKSVQHRQVETVTREVQKIIERPVYQQHCFDDSGLQQLNSLINSDSSEPP
jgi:LPS O-antigen subunit length determinant protein (WzzB/FepE family)